MPEEGEDEEVAAREVSDKGDEEREREGGGKGGATGTEQ